MSVQLKEKLQLTDEDEIIKKQICPKATDQQYQLFKATCARTGLNPLMKQIYAVFREDKKNGGYDMSIQTSIDGYRLIADRTGRYAPGKATAFSYNPDGKLVSAIAYVKKMTPDGTWHEVEAIAFYDEYVQVFNKEPTKFWKDMEHNQLSKCAETLAIKKGFPQETSMLRTTEEMNNRVAQHEAQEQIELNEKTGEIKEIPIIPVSETASLMTRNHVEELEALIGKDKEYYASILRWYEVKSLEDIPDFKFIIIKEKTLQRIKLQEYK